MSAPRPFGFRAQFVFSPGAAERHTLRSSDVAPSARNGEPGPLAVMNAGALEDKKAHIRKSAVFPLSGHIRHVFRSGYPFIPTPMSIHSPRFIIRRRRLAIKENLSTPPTPSLSRLFLDPFYVRLEHQDLDTALFPLSAALLSQTRSAIT